MNTKAIIALSLVSTMSIATTVHAQHADLLLIKDDAGNLLTGQYDFGSNQIVSTNTRVYEGEFDIFGTSDEPGFNALSASNIPTEYQALNPNSEVSFTASSFQIGSISANLFYWNGQGEVDFAAASNILTISKAPSTIFSAVLDGSNTNVDGFNIATTSSDGFLHKHIDLGLTDISSSANGFYLWSLSIQSGLDSTDPVFFVHDFGTEDETAHEAAIEWVQSNIVPAPATLALLLGLPAMSIRRRR